MGSTMVKIGSTELLEQSLASFNQISKTNKPHNNNKHLLIVVTETDLGQRSKLIQGGSQWSNGQTKGQGFNTGRRWVCRTKIET